MNNLDKEIQRIVKQEIELPKEYRNNIQKTLENCTQNSKYRKKKNRITSTLKKIGLTILVGATAITAYATGTKNFEFAKTGLSKIDENYQESAVDINQTIENEYLKITLDSMAADESYVITEFIIELKEKAINEIGTKEQEKMEIEFSDNILIDSKTVRKEITNIEKISENKFAYTQVINKMNYNSEKNNFMMYINNIYIRLNEQEPWKGFAINKKIQLDIENKNDKNEFVEKEYILDENNKMVIKSITNSKFETYLLIQRITENITYGEYSKGRKYDNFIITNNNNEKMLYRLKSNKKIYIKNSNNEMEEVDYEYKLEQNDTIKLVQDFVIYFRENINSKDINIIPVKSELYDTVDEYNAAEWYPVTDGETKYSAESNLGGKIEIEKIIIDEENISFYYNESGLIGVESLVIIRKNNGKINYIYPTTQEKGKVSFSRMTDLYAGTNTGYLDKLKSIENLQFTLLYGGKSEIVGDTIQIEIPEQNNATAEFSNIKISDAKVTNIKCSYKTGITVDENGNQQDCIEVFTYKLYYDEDDNLLHIESGSENPRVLLGMSTDRFKNVTDAVERFEKYFTGIGAKFEIIDE